MPLLVPYPASLVSGWEPAPITRYPSKCHMQAISWTNMPQFGLQFGCDKGIEEQHIMSSQLDSPKTNGFTVDGLHFKTGCGRDGSGCAGNHLLSPFAKTTSTQAPSPLQKFPDRLIGVDNSSSQQIRSNSKSPFSDHGSHHVAIIC